jgi:hypothetical protein
MLILKGLRRNESASQLQFILLHWFANSHVVSGEFELLHEDR